MELLCVFTRDSLLKLTDLGLGRGKMYYLIPGICLQELYLATATCHCHCAIFTKGCSSFVVQELN